MNTTLGQDADEVHKVLGKQGVSFCLAEQALELAGPQAPYSVFAIVDALNRIAGRYVSDVEAWEETRLTGQPQRLLVWIHPELVQFAG